MTSGPTNPVILRKTLLAHSVKVVANSVAENHMVGDFQGGRSWRSGIHLSESALNNDRNTGSYSSRYVLNGVGPVRERLSETLTQNTCLKFLWHK